MKRRDLIRRLEQAAKTQNTTFVFVREGGSHTVYSYGGQNVIIPRHGEVKEQTARNILRQFNA